MGIVNDKEDYAGLIERMPKALGVGRSAKMEKSIWVYFERPLTDDEMRDLHDLLAKRVEAASALTTLTQDAKRMDWLEETFKACPHTQITFNDDPDMEDDHGEIPLGYSMRIDGCSPLEAAASTFRELIDAAMEGKVDE